MVSYTTKLLLTILLRFVIEIPLTHAANATQWQSRSIYQVRERSKNAFLLLDPSY